LKFTGVHALPADVCAEDLASHVVQVRFLDFRTRLLQVQLLCLVLLLEVYIGLDGPIASGRSEPLRLGYMCSSLRRLWLEIQERVGWCRFRWEPGGNYQF